VGPVVDQDGERDSRELVSGDRQQLRQPQCPELGDREYITEGCLRGLLRCFPRGRRVFSYDTLRSQVPLARR
jgi:hypothetical protein